MGSGPRLKARWRLARASVKSLFWIVAGVGLVLVVLLRTGLGHRVVLNWGLGQLRSRVAGDVTVGDIRSASLLRGATLMDVRLTAPDGRLFVSVDSLSVSYRALGLIRGELVFTDVDLWGPRVDLTRRPGEDGSTLQAWIGARPGGEGGGPIPALRFQDVAIHGGEVTVIQPLATPPDTAGVLRWESSADGPLRRYDVSDVEARAPLVTTGGEGIRVRIGTLDALAHVLEEPLRLADVQGELALSADTLHLGLDQGTLDDVEARGSVVLALGDSAGVTGRIELDVEKVDLERFRWLIPSLPALTGSARVAGTLASDGQTWTVTGLDGRLAGGSVSGGGTLLTDPVRLRAVDVELSGVAVAALDPWLAEPLPLEGTVSGAVRLSGPPGALDSSGRLTLATDGRAPVTADFEGTVRLGVEGGLAVQGFRATVDPLDWSLVGVFVPAFRLEGSGSALVEATGSFAEGLRFSADLRHVAGGGPVSHLLADGSIRKVEDVMRVDVQGDLSPLSFDALRVSYPELPLGGEISGWVRAVGTLRDLEVRTEVDTELGRVDLTGRLNARDLGSQYRVEGTVSEFLASALVPALPDPTRISGRVEVDGRGIDPATLTAQARLALGSSRLGGLTVDTVALTARARGGVLHVDTLVALTGGFDIRADGTLAMDSVRPAGEVQVRFATESLLGLRSLFMGDSILTRDGLDQFERDALRFEGIDPDTLPAEADVAMDGRARGTVTLRGSVADFSADGEATVTDLVYRHSALDSARVQFGATGLPGLAGRLQLDLDAEGADLLDRTFQAAHAEVDFTRPEGTAVLELIRSGDEDYRARARFVLDSLGGAVELEEMALRFDTLRYGLTSPAGVAWSDSAVTVRDFELVRPGSSPVRIRADGVLPARGQADFTFDAQGIRLERMAGLLQREDMALEGTVDLEARIQGTARDPLIDGSFSLTDLRWESVEVNRAEGTLGYAGREATVDLQAWSGRQRIVEVSGRVPLDLGFTGVTDRTPARAMDLRVRADSLPAVFVLSILEDLEDVEGSFTGDVRLRGTVDEPSPAGSLTLRNGAWTVAALGVRQSRVQADLELVGERTVRVDASARADGGTVQVDGTVELSNLTDPAFDLTLRLDRFQAVNRRDVVGRVSGQARLTDSFESPLVEGELRVDEGILFIDEFQRSLGVVDLSDPRFFALLDTTVLRGRPLLAETRNPFMQNLRVDIDLSVERDTWLRSNQMNVEIGGELLVVYDRPSQDLVMVGELEAIRGQYTILGRTFEVESGVVEFVGTPGINPNLDIQAVARVRRREGEPLEVVANLAGTLVEPRVELTARGESVAQTDLLSYLVTGSPGSALTAGATSAAESAGVSFVLGTLSSSISSLLRGTGGLDYINISQAADVTLGGAVSSALRGTQLEVGRYLFGGDYFAALVLRLPGAGSSSNAFAGFRLEWQASDQYHLEVFMEDRFLRSGAFAFQEFGINSQIIYGISLIREWGY